MKREYLSPDEAAARLGWTGQHRGRRLVNVMFAKEKRRQQEIMIRRGGAVRTRYLLTQPMLERYCPELFLRTPDEIANRLRPALEGLEARVEAIVDERLAPQVEELRRVDDLQSRAIQKIERRVARLERSKTDVRFHVECDGVFYSYDRHGAGHEFWSEWGEPFVCAWDSRGEAEKFARPCDAVRVSIDGKLDSGDGHA